MRLSSFSIGLLALLAPLTSAWSKDDGEIFRIRDELAAYEGPGVTFYDFLGVPASASQDDISKAYRKRSRSLHPDKVKQQLTAERAKASKAKSKTAKKGVDVSKPPSQSEVQAAVKHASESQTRLSLVANILRGPGRERYDHFLANGFPVWKGTGYYYNRYRPGLATVLVGVFLLGGGGAHYIALYMGWKRQREFVERYIKFARRAAWGENLGINIPGVDGAPAAAPPPPPPAASPDDDAQGPPAAMNRKQRRMQEQDARRKAAKDGGAGAGASRRARRATKGGGASGAGSGTATPQPASAGPQGARKKVVAENGKVLIVDSLGDVYLQAEDEEGNLQEFLLDPNEIAKPKVTDTAIIRLPIWLFQTVVSRVKGGNAADADDADADEGEEEEGIVVNQSVAAAEGDDDDDSEPGKHTPGTDSAEDFELLKKSVDSLDKAKASGSQAAPGKGKPGKRKGDKR